MPRGKCSPLFVTGSVSNCLRGQSARSYEQVSENPSGQSPGASVLENASGPIPGASGPIPGPSGLIRGPSGLIRGARVPSRGAVPSRGSSGPSRGSSGPSRGSSGPSRGPSVEMPSSKCSPLFQCGFVSNCLRGQRAQSYEQVLENPSGQSPGASVWRPPSYERVFENASGPSRGASGPSRGVSGRSLGASGPSVSGRSLGASGPSLGASGRSRGPSPVVYSGRFLGESFAAPISAVKETKNATLEYELTGVNFGPFHQGSTKFGSSKNFDISVRKFENSREPCTFFNSMRRLCMGGGGRVAEVFFVDGANLILERVNCDFKSWLSSEYEQFKLRVVGLEGDLSLLEGDLSGWWSLIKVRFISIFRDLIEALRFLYARNHVSCGLMTANSIIRGGLVYHAKLTFVKQIVDQTELKAAMRQNIRELRDMMVMAITWPYRQGSGVTKSEEDAFFKMQNIPYDLHSFLSLLISEQAECTDIHWLLDDSAFWTPDEKLKIVRKLYNLAIGMNKFLPAWESNNYIDSELDKQNFDLLSFVDDPRVVEVYRKAAEDRKTHEKGKGKLVPEYEVRKEREDFKFGSFKKILRYFRNFDQHYNKPSENETPVPCMKEKEELTEYVDGLFGSACSLFRHSLGAAWFACGELEGYEFMNHLLSEIPF